MKQISSSQDDLNFFQCYCFESFCKDKQCKSRHPRTCKFGDECRFLKMKCCLFKHTITKSVTNDKQKEESKVLEREVIELKAMIDNLQDEISELKGNVKIKEEQIEEISFERSKSMKKESKECNQL